MPCSFIFTGPLFFAILRAGKALDEMKLTIKFVSRTVAAVACVATLSLSIYAQQAGAPARPPTRRTDTVRREGTPESELERDLMFRELEEMGTRKPAAQTDPRATFAKIEEDFMRIQIVNNELAQAAARDSSTLDLKFVAVRVTEIKERAGRLKKNLALPKAEQSDKRMRAAVGTEPEQLRSALNTLGPLIAGFAHNPIFKEGRVVDVELSTKARRDLEDIIDLSEQIKKRSEQLEQAARKPR